MTKTAILLTAFAAAASAFSPSTPALRSKPRHAKPQPKESSIQLLKNPLLLMTTLQMRPPNPTRARSHLAPHPRAGTSSLAATRRAPQGLQRSGVTSLHASAINDQVRPPQPSTLPLGSETTMFKPRPAPWRPQRSTIANLALGAHDTYLSAGNQPGVEGATPRLRHGRSVQVAPSPPQNLPCHDPFTIELCKQQTGALPLLDGAAPLHFPVATDQVRPPPTAARP